MHKKQKFFQAVGEAVIPILGFFYFDWDLYFILLFFFIDLACTELFLHLKIKRIRLFKKDAGKKISSISNFTFLSIILMVALIVVAHVAVLVITPTIDFYSSFIEFLSYEELGIPIPQGVILFPLVLLGNYMQYKQFFITTQQYRFFEEKYFFKRRMKALSIGIAGAGLSIGMAFFLGFPEVIFLLLLVGVKFFVDFKMRY